MIQKSYAPSTLTLSAVSVVRGERCLIKNLNFSLQSGEVLLLQGDNGSGKTSLLRVICGLLAAAEGKIAFNFHGGENLDYDVTAHCHLLGHQDGLKASLTVLENLTWLCEILKADSPREEKQTAAQSRKRILTALEALHLGHVIDTPMRLLSAGQRRRVALAKLLLVPRPLWLLDEPGNALDSAALKSFEALVRAHVAKNGLVIIATHQAFDFPHARTHVLRRPPVDVMACA